MLRERVRPWRPILVDGTGARPNPSPSPSPSPSPTAAGHQSAIVVGEGPERVDPLLVRLPADDTQAVPAFAQWRAERPMLSLIVSPLTLPRLAAHLRDQTEAVTADGEHYLLRNAIPGVSLVADALHSSRKLQYQNGFPSL